MKSFYYQHSQHENHSRQPDWFCAIRYLAIFILSFNVYSQNEICSYIWNNTVNCPARLSCISEADYDNKTFIVPGNVTRIGQTGLEFCLSDTSVTNPVDLVFVVDYSGSMASDYGSRAGDPYGKRPEAISSGAHYLIDSVPGSTIGYAAFAGELVLKANYTRTDYIQYITRASNQRVWRDNVWQPMDVNTSVLPIENMLDTIQHDALLYNLGATNYFAGLNQALQWFKNPSLTPNANKMIIFISDGEPNSPGSSDSYYKKQRDSLMALGVIINTVYLGSVSTMPAKLAALASTVNGGTATVVPPNNTDTLATVIRAIVKENTAYSFGSLTVSSNGITASGVNPVKNVSGGTWSFSLDRIIPLNPGANPVALYSRFVSGSTEKTISFDFTLSVSGSPDENCYECHEMSKIDILSTEGAPLDSLTFEITQFRVRLSYYGSDDLTAATAVITTKKGDRENKALTYQGMSGGARIFEGTMAFAMKNSSEGVTINNGITEANVSDSVFVSWFHPLDQRDSDADTARVLSSANIISLYTQAGEPAGTGQKIFPTPPSQDTVTAGSHVNLYAKLFTGTIWLSKYETDPAFSSQIHWKVLNAATSKADATIGTLTSSAANPAVFNPVKAYISVDITASFFNGLDTIRATTRLYIMPGPAGMLSIEANNSSSCSPNSLPIPQLEIVTVSNTSNQSAPVYAILRDAFGNFISPAQSAGWTFTTQGIATVTTGSSASEAIIHRSLHGTTRLAASRGALTDTITVVILGYTWTAIQITTGIIVDTITSIELLSDADTTTLVVYGKRSNDGVWELCNQTLWGRSGVSLTPAAPSGSATWSFVPASTGSGTVTATFSNGLNTTISDQISITILGGNPVNMLLYDTLGNPAVCRQLPVDTAIMAGESILAAAKLFNNLDEWIAAAESDTAISNRITWSATDRRTSSTEILNRGNFTRFSSTKAHRIYDISAVYEYQGARIVRTVAVTIIPGPAATLTIEPGYNWQAYPDRPQLFPNDTLTLTTEAFTARVYAILRDSYGNFVAYSNPASWSSSDAGQVTVSNGEQAELGEGLISRAISSGSASITASQGTLSGSVNVKILGYYYSELQIFVKTQNGPICIDSLVLNTNQDTALYVMGQRSNDPLKYDTISASWEFSTGLQTILGDPVETDSFFVSPADTGRGWVRVTLGNDQKLRPDTIQVIIDRGPPTNIRMDLVTDAGSRIAGQPIETSLIIENKDGRVPGTWCGYAIFDDLLEYRQITPDGDTLNPLVIIDGDTVSSGETALICFIDGVAMVDLVLYYAPSSQYLHALTVTFTDTVSNTPLKDSTQTVLKPGPVSNISIVEQVNPPASFDGDSALIHFNEGLTIYLVGHDAFGNFIGPVKGNWSTDNTIPSIVRPENTQQIYYTAMVLYEESGFIHAVYAGDSTIADSLFISIKPQPAKLLSADTRDLDGDGYLDAMVLQFDKNVEFPPYFPLSNFDISYRYDASTIVNFTVDSINPSGSAATTIVLYFSEDMSTVPGIPQTNWTPDVALRNTGSFDVGDTTLTGTDGAGPVIWSVLKIVSSSGDRTNDKVIVTFSEPVFAPDGSPLSFSIPPSEMFAVWIYDEFSEKYVRVDSILTGITTLSEAGENTVVFYMTNGENLTANHRFSINTDQAPVLGDVVQNQPNTENRKVNVDIKGALGNISAGPNPMHPVFSHSQNDLEHVNPQTAYSWAKNEGGAVMTTEITLSEEDATTLMASGSMMIFDAVGNLVYSRKSSDNLIPESWHSDWVQGSNRQLVFYWNGITDRDMRAAPGIYRTVIMVKWGNQHRKYVGNIGIGR